LLLTVEDGCGEVGRLMLEVVELLELLGLAGGAGSCW
jgi:hypothetical protein